jgi:hypothetical protein
LEAVEQGGGAFDLEFAGGKGVDDDGEGDLDGLAVFEGGEFDVLSGDEVAAGGFGVAKGGVALMEAVVEVAPLAIGEGWGFAAGSVGLDVATERVLHDLLLCLVGGTPPLPACKSNGYNYLAKITPAKYVQPLGLRPNMCQQRTYWVKYKSPSRCRGFFSIYIFSIPG